MGQHYPGSGAIANRPVSFLRQHSMILHAYPGEDTSPNPRERSRNSFINCWLKRPFPGPSFRGPCGRFPLENMLNLVFVWKTICAGSSSGPSATVAVGIQFDALQKGYAWQMALLMLAGHNVDGCFSLGLLGSMVRSPVGYNPKRPHL